MEGDDFFDGEDVPSRQRRGQQHRGGQNRRQQNQRPTNRTASGVRILHKPTFDAEGNEVPLTEDQRSRLAEKAFNSCLWHLERGDKTVKQLDEKLTVKGVPEDIREQVITRLTDMNFVNDERYAENYIRSASTRKGRVVIRMELQRKGVSPDTVGELLDEIDEDAEIEVMRTEAFKKARTLRNVEPMKAQNRLYGMLARRGFPASKISTVVKEVLGELQDEWGSDEVP